jgi:RimK family alpha-L-glutamate ligase
MNKEVCILGKNNRNCYEIDRLKQEFSKKNCSVNCLDYKSILLFDSMKSSLGIIDKKTGLTINVPDLVYNGSGGYEINLIAKKMFYSKIPVFNNPFSHEIADNKMSTSQILCSNNIPIPDTLVISPPYNIELICDIIGLPVVIKTISGHHGEGVYVCDNYHSLKSFLQMCAKINISNTTLLAQKYSSKHKGLDLRIWVIDNEVIGGMIRHNISGDFRANIAQGAIGKKIELTSSIKDLAVKSVNSLGLSFAGIDILMDLDFPKICEVNAAAEFKAFESVTNINIADNIVNYLLKKLNHD